MRQGFGPDDWQAPGGGGQPPPRPEHVPLLAVLLLPLVAGVTVGLALAVALILAPMATGERVLYPAALSAFLLSAPLTLGLAKWLSRRTRVVGRRR